MFNTPNGQLVQPLREEVPIGAIIARRKLSEAKRWFQYQGLDQLPSNERGKKIMRWACDLAWVAAEKYPERSVRRWCNRWCKWMTPAQISTEVERARTSNKRWSGDQCAEVLEINLDNHVRLKMAMIGANDDPNYERRNDLRRLKNKNRMAEKRLVKGAKPRAKALTNTKPWMELGMSRATWYRLGKPIPNTKQELDNVINLADHRS